MNGAKSDHTLNPDKIYQLEEENKSLRRAVDELAILNELALAISGSLDSEKIMRTIIGRSIRTFQAEQGDITLVDEEQSVPAQTLVRSIISTSEYSPLHLNQNILGWMQIHKKPLMINDPENDGRFKNVKWERSIHSLISAPLMTRSKLIGILTIYNKRDPVKKFTESDQRLLSIIAAQSAQVVENARLYEEEQSYRFMRRELELASNIQKKMLPASAPEINGYSIAGKNVTAQEVGGDYFDYIQMDEHKWAICLGDISGKGLPASLLMSNLQAILRGQTFHLHQPGEILRSANRQLYHSTNPDKFATLFLAILDTSKNTLHYSSGGHEFPFLLRQNGTIIRLKTGGLPLGMMDDQNYNEELISLNPGDVLFAFSDGVTDTTNQDQVMFGEQRLEQLLQESTQKNLYPDDLIDLIVDACLNHSGNEKLFDDITAVALRKNL